MLGDDGLIAFGPGRYLFRLPLPRVIEVERLCGAPGQPKALGTIYEELSQGIGLDHDTLEPRFLATGAIHPKDVYEVIRCAAIGGGEAEIAGETVKIGPVDAARLVEEYVASGEPGLFAAAIPVAWLILHQAFMGVSLKKKADAEAESTAPLTEAS